VRVTHPEHAWNLLDFSFESFGHLVNHSVTTDSAGIVTDSDYLYQGVFDMTITLESVTGSTRTGTFVAPILMALHVTGENALYPDVDGYYTLGPGIFDPFLAEAFGVARHTLGGDISSDFDRSQTTGAYDAAHREAWDAAPYIRIQAVPEPSALLLGVLAIAMARVRYRTHHASTGRAC
jgi:hypothetical protein